ncbi:MAG: carboxypeptidase regulatory-like domain-containing protein [Pseudomonadales bacterium]|nr:carboxypeptidase regulatory-like domain-containing protein [Pseudomonadales bacterium]
MPASISGSVTDSDGRPVANIKVSAFHEPTGSTFGKVTGEDGAYTFDMVKVGGPYTLTAEGDGFSAARKTGISLRTDQSHVEDFMMEVSG